ALGPFAEAAAQIELAGERCAERIGVLDRQLEARLATLERQKAARIAEFAELKDAARASAAGEASGWRARMAVAVGEIRAADVTAAEAAMVLGISVREVAALTREAASPAPEGTDADDHRALPRPGDAASPTAATAEPGTSATAGDSSTAEAPDGGPAADVESPVPGASGW